jgi:predicted component of type VI protein secretion system
MQVARLTAVTRGDTRTILLSPGHVVTLGRSSRCTVPLRDRKVSRVHCQVSFDQGHVVAADLDSRHGMQHLGQKKTILAMQAGDGFHIGETFVRFVALMEVDDATVASWFAPGGIYAPRTAAEVAADAAADAAAEAEEDGDDAANDNAASAASSAAPSAPVAAGRDPSLDAFFAAADVPPPAATPAPAPAAAAAPVADVVPPPEPAPTPRVVMPIREPELGDYPDFGPDVARGQPQRRRASAGKTLAARLAAESIVFSIHMALCLVLLLALRVAVGLDIYRLFGFGGS